MQPGVYIDLSEEEYFAVDALGSSDIKKLLRAPHDWWYSSRHNPHYEEPERGIALILGSALHALMLEGTQAYEARFAIEPDPNDHPGALKTSDQIRDFLKLCDVHVPSKLSKTGLIDLAVENGLGERIWDNIIRHHVQDVELFGKVSIQARQDRALRAMAKLVEDTPAIADGLKIGLPEVSVFWRRDDVPGVLFRGRIDSLNEKFTLDLKTLSNWRGRTVSDMPRRQIEEMEYDVQRRFYDEARQAIRSHVEAGNIFFPRDTDQPVDKAYEKRVVKRLKAIAKVENWIWVWLFYQMRDDKAGRAPIVIPRWHAPEGDVYEQAGLKVDRAIQNYRDLVAQFGTDTPWHHIEPALELEDSDLAGLQFKAPF